jgi:hypothetical protein
MNILTKRAKPTNSRQPMMIKVTAILTSFLPFETQVMGSLFQAARRKPILLSRPKERCQIICG